MIEFGLLINGEPIQLRTSDAVVDADHNFNGLGVVKAFKAAFPEYANEIVGDDGSGTIIHMEMDPQLRPLSDWAVGYRIVDKRE